jgi:hypothetical protein
LTAPGGLLDALKESPIVSAKVVTSALSSALDRISEPNEDRDDQIVYHLSTIVEIVKRIYQENRDTSLREDALNLVDKLCLLGALDQNKFD